MANYNVIDIDPSMVYAAPGDELIATVEAATPDEAIAMVMRSIGIDVMKELNPIEYTKYILSSIKAVEVAS
jgi:uncharacterized protein (DUF1697 family)